MASCAQVERLVQSYLDGEVDKREKTALEHHIHRCAHCTALLAKQEECNQFVLDALAPSKLQQELTPSILAHLPEMDSQIRRRKRVWMGHGDTSFFPKLSAAAPVMAVAVLVVVAMSLFYLWPPSVDINGDVIGLVTHESGRVQHAHVSSTETELVELKNVVYSDERFETFDDSQLMLSLSGDTELKLAENTRVVVQGPRRVRVESGRAWLNVGKDGRHFRVKTPEGTVLVFGTAFEVNVDTVYGNTVVTVEEGEVQVDTGEDFTSLKPGDQVRMAAKIESLTPVRVNSDQLLAWAHDILPDPSADRLYKEKIRSLGMRVVQAEMVFLISDIGAKGVESLLLQWEPDSHDGGHSAYDVYVSELGGEETALFQGRLDASLFTDKSRNQYELPVPEGVSMNGVRMLQIKIVPDLSTGTVETDFDVKAIKAVNGVGI